MDISTLNSAQREAVTAPLEHILLLAGAGSGKTKCLTHRIAWLLKTEQTYPHNILAVTFTNKAANEMRSRIDALLKKPAKGLWAGTFHSIAHRLLRIHWKDANLPQAFQILDSQDQLRILKQVVKSLNIDKETLSPKRAQHFINACKDEALRAKDIVIEVEEKFLKAKMLEIYSAYEETCQRTGVVDFAELLLRSYELLRDHPPLLEYYQQRFRHIHVDEFQDTNTIQYKNLQLLAGKQGKMFVVFDDDQSIYAWRGAKLENIQQIQQDFSETRLMRLEQNYRSTGIILEAANALIANNKGRLGKKLWTQDKAGEPVNLYTAYSEIDEAQFVAEKIQAWQGKRVEIAILYRTTAQSRQFEEALLLKGMPYRIYGGQRFYERLEIKNMLAYLRLLVHRDDDSAFERVINTPKRGIGNRTVDILRSLARQQGNSMWQAACAVLETKQLKARAANSLTTFLNLIEQLTAQLKDLPLHEKVEQIKIVTGFIAHYKKESKQEAEKRLENLEELVTAARQFEQLNKNKSNLLTAFLDHAALEAGERQSSQFDDCVQLMTLHAAKGLEFKVVFICGLEEGLFPHQNSLDESKLEEERRLCYVGITRARQYLYLCHSKSRYRYGMRDRCIPSRFIQEVPLELIQDVRLKSAMAPSL
ncbi:MAG: DNA helicase II [Gammaproteobacteria bacterium]|nr:MAG: DNA helicase II [Gammaproteobacteria bacterium]